jgi:hypothetical protein
MATGRSASSLCSEARDTDFNGCKALDVQIGATRSATVRLVLVQCSQTRKLPWHPKSRNPSFNGRSYGKLRHTAAAGRLSVNLWAAFRKTDHSKAQALGKSNSSCPTVIGSPVVAAQALSKPGFFPTVRRERPVAEISEQQAREPEPQVHCETTAAAIAFFRCAVLLVTRRREAVLETVASRSLPVTDDVH